MLLSFSEKQPVFYLRHEQQRHGLVIDNGGDDNRDMYGYYKCSGPCTLAFATDATRKRYFLHCLTPYWFAWADNLQSYLLLDNFIC